MISNEVSRIELAQAHGMGMGDASGDAFTPSPNFAQTPVGSQPE
jgi:hypothetical protein